MPEPYKFNSPDFDSRKFDPLKAPKFKSGEAFARHQRIVADGLKQLGVNQNIDVPDIEKLSNQAQAIYAEAEHIAHRYFAEGIAAGRPAERLAAIKEVQMFFLDKFVHFNHDEVLVLLSTFLTKSVIDKHL